MQDWSKDFFEAIDFVATELEQFFEEVEEVVEMVADEINIILVQDLDQFLEDLFEPFLDADQDFDYFGDLDPSMGDKVKPSLDKFPACIGCQNYHGYSHGGNLLICGMHPYGWDGESCPDWEDGN